MIIEYGCISCGGLRQSSPQPKEIHTVLHLILRDGLKFETKECESTSSSR
jgi:hypothetical protein